MENHAEVDSSYTQDEAIVGRLYIRAARFENEAKELRTQLNEAVRLIQELQKERHGLKEKIKELAPVENPAFVDVPAETHE